MWTPWQTALLAGIFGGCSTLWPFRDFDFLYLTVSSLVMMILVASLTWLGLRASRRPMLSVKAAVMTLVAVALVCFYSAQPIVTHAVVRNLPSGTPGDRMTWTQLFSIAVLFAPALIAFAAGRLAGAPPNKSFERTREG